MKKLLLGLNIVCIGINIANIVLCIVTMIKKGVNLINVLLSLVSALVIIDCAEDINKICDMSIDSEEEE